MKSNGDFKKIKRVSAGSVILRQDNGTWQALLLRAWTHWDFPKGNVENGESLYQAAIREVKEETGITDLNFPWGESFSRTSIYSGDKIAYYSIAETNTSEVILAPNPITAETEHEEFLWCPWDDLQKYLSPRLDCILIWVADVVGLNPPEPRDIINSMNNRKKSKKFKPTF